MRATMLALAATTMLAACSPQPVTVDDTRTSAIANPMDSVVKVVAKGGGHGSGVHIGDGYIITAAHVLAGPVDYVEFESGAQEDVDVLWINKEYDVALMRMVDEDGAIYVIPSADIDCRAPDVGEAITALGNPGREDFIAIRGYTASNAREVAPSWKSAIVTDISAAGGISGGPLLADDGRVVGIMVGVMLAPVARTEKPKSMNDYDLSQTGISYMVPADAICMLMARM